MASFLLTAPSVEPLTLAEAKNFLRVEIEDDDDLIVALIAAARIHIEAETRRALTTQTWRLVRDEWPADGRLRVLPAPLREVAAARVYDAQNLAHDIDPQAFVVDTAGAALTFAPWALAAPGRAFAGIEIDVSVGYGDTAADVPEPYICLFTFPNLSLWLRMACAIPCKSLRALRFDLSQGSSVC